MQEIVTQVGFMLGIPTNEPVESQQIEMAVSIAFQELKRYIRTPTEKTVPYARRISLGKVGIITKKVMYCFAARPRLGLTLSTIESGNVFQIAAAVNTMGGVGQMGVVNIDPIMTEMGMAQVRNTLATDFQWSYDIHNDVVYCAHRDPVPAQVTIRYIPEYTDVSELQGHVWENYLIRLSEAFMKRSLGRSRSKYVIEGSNVTNDGTILLAEATDELATIRAELEQKRSKIVVLN